jgi:hypothetical protein
MVSFKGGYNDLQPDLPNQVKGRDQYLKAGGLSSSDSMEPAKDHMRHGGLRAP